MQPENPQLPIFDLSSSSLKLCVEGTQAEFAGEPEKARALYRSAWEASSTDLEACVAAHYVARFQDDPQEKLRWNQIALDKANSAADDSVKTFFPSLYLNLGQSYELLGNTAEAKRFYDLAASLGLPHQLT